MVHQQRRVQIEEKRKLRLKRRKEEEEDSSLKEARLAKNIPRTIENLRVEDETFVDENDKEVEAEFSTDAFQAILSGAAHSKVLITTCLRPNKVYFHVLELHVIVDKSY